MHAILTTIAKATTTIIGDGGGGCIEGWGGNGVTEGFGGLR